MGALDIRQEHSVLRDFCALPKVLLLTHPDTWSELMELELVRKQSVFQWGGFLSELHNSQSRDLGNRLGEKWGAVSNVGRWGRKD